MVKRGSLLVFCLSFGALGLVGMPATAHACTYARVILQSSFPADGAENVPLDSRILLYGPTIGAQQFRLQDGDGNAVPIDVTPAGERGLQVGVIGGLEANTRYVLGVRDSVDEIEEVVTFTTGDAPLGQQPALSPPDVQLRLLDEGGELDSCGPRTGICLRGEAPAGSSLEIWVGGDVIQLGSGERRPVYRMYGAVVEPRECIEVRVRGPAGAVSEPTTFCENDGLRLDVSPEATYPSCSGAFTAIPVVGDAEADPGSEDTDLAGTDVAEPSRQVVEGGCALRPTGTTSGASGLVLGLATWLVAGRRRVRRRGT